MTSNEIIQALKAEPFRAFRVHMGGGRTLDVPHREFASVSPNNRIAIIFDEDGAPEVVDIFMIQSIQVLPERKSGEPRRRKAGEGREGPGIHDRSLVPEF